MPNTPPPAPKKSKKRTRSPSPPNNNSLESVFSKMTTNQKRTARRLKFDNTKKNLNKNKKA